MSLLEGVKNILNGEGAASIPILQVLSLKVYGTPKFSHNGLYPPPNNKAASPPAQSLTYIWADYDIYEQT